MNSTSITRPQSARMFFFPGATDVEAQEVLARSIDERGSARSAIRGRRQLSGSALEVVIREIATVVDGLLGHDLGSMLVAGWRKYGALTEAAKRTHDTPGSEEIVVLATHQVTSTYRPHVDLFVDNVKVKTFVLELSLVFDLNGLVAAVRSGDLVTLRGGECTVTATLSLDGEQLAQRQGHIDPAMVVQLHPPLSLLGKVVPPGPHSHDSTVRLDREATDTPPSPGTISRPRGWSV